MKQLYFSSITIISCAVTYLLFWFLKQYLREIPQFQSISLTITSEVRKLNHKLFLNLISGTSLVVQWLRIHLLDEWIRKFWYMYTMEYHSAIKKNTFQSVLMRWLKLEPIIQSEVSQKEKHQYSILTNIHGIQKDGNDNPICQTTKETHV